MSGPIIHPAATKSTTWSRLVRAEVSRGGRRRNYSVNFGNSNMTPRARLTAAPLTDSYNGPAGIVNLGEAPFYANGTERGLRDIIDGSSTTLMMSEVIRAVN